MYGGWKVKEGDDGQRGAYCYHCSTTIEDYHTPAGVRVEVRFFK